MDVAVADDDDDDAMDIEPDMMEVVPHPDTMMDISQ